MGACLVCGFSPCEVQKKIEYTFLNCDNCGECKITRTARNKVEYLNSAEKTKLGHAIWKMQGKGEGKDYPVINGDNIKDILKNSLPHPIEQGDLAILYIGDQTKDNPGKSFESISLHLCSKIGALGIDGVDLIISNLRDEGYLTKGGDASKVLTKLTFSGWRKYSELLKGKADSKKAFMAMPFNNNVLDEMYRDNWQKAVEETGFQLKRVDEEPKAGLIDNHLRVELLTCRFVVAEITSNNNGVYWEAGFAEGQGKPVFYLCEESNGDANGNKRHFDVDHNHTVFWNKNNIPEAMENLKATIRATLPSEAKMDDES